MSIDPTSYSPTRELAEIVTEAFGMNSRGNPFSGSALHAVFNGAHTKNEVMYQKGTIEKLFEKL
jgi:hypothetical protein